MIRKISKQENCHVHESRHVNKESSGTLVSKIQILPIEVTQRLPNMVLKDGSLSRGTSHHVNGQSTQPIISIHGNERDKLFYKYAPIGMEPKISRQINSIPPKISKLITPIFLQH